MRLCSCAKLFQVRQTLKYWTKISWNLAQNTSLTLLVTTYFRTTTMRLDPNLLNLLALIAFLQYQPVSALPPHPLSPDLTLTPKNNHTSALPASFRTPPSSIRPLRFHRTTWNITPTLHLALVITDWQPPPPLIITLLHAALRTISKRPLDGLVTQKFIQRSPSKLNTLYFEIEPKPGEPSRLTWEDVGYVVGEGGLEAFYEDFFVRVEWWNTVYFTLLETGSGGRGMLGSGAVRRWWQLGKPRDGGTVEGRGGSI